ncbi:NAD(+)--rifampin ADP-ribosyltransferase [Parvibaculum sp.]|uniref:NAD(+)--rifampin ADP-ribosyltransferase n=1 Tax=Parvibaculum sp. TaxID=2024848 RepID=UPI002C2D36B1|nr:NAD(+)--rifampin ADP-ribosyltransferase [Parvibaculum sp.]HUD50256.1 NAD(+)--rifampin ADP-ribosyltransferase [Parvibaculum sp.]
MSASASMFAQSFFHGTRADLKPGDLIIVGYQSNFTEARALSWVYFAGTLDAAIWGAELAAGSGPGRIYVVEPTGPFMDDPNLTDKKFPGNPTLSYRSRDPLRVIAEVTKWQGHPPERLQQMKEGLARLNPDGSDIID